MAKLPIRIQKIKTKGYNNQETVKYLVTIFEKGSYFDKTAICERDELVSLVDDINQVLADSSTAEVLNISEQKAELIDQAHASEELCKSCGYRMTHDCLTCQFDLQSPLERKLFLELKIAYINFTLRYNTL
jgi:hypothetical protein